MDDKDKLDRTDTFVPYDHLTSKTKLLKSLSALLERDIEAPNEPVRIPSRTETNPVVQPRVGWTRRVLGWFRRD